jgi:hypothetical protein
MAELKLGPPKAKDFQKGKDFQIRSVSGSASVSENSTFRVLFIFGKGLISRRGKSWLGSLCV